MKQQALEAFRETLAVFNEHLEKGLKLAPPHELLRYIFMVVCSHCSCSRRPLYTVSGLNVYSIINAIIQHRLVIFVFFIITSAEEGGYVFSSVCLSVCLFVCLSVRRITRKLVNGF